MHPLYVDLDATLIHSEEDRDGEFRIYPRPGADRFLKRLARHGDVYILSHATLPHVQDALPYLGDGAAYLSGIITREDLKPVIDELNRLESERLPRPERERRRAGIEPIVPPGVIFDDQPVDSVYYRIKATAMGIGPGMWIQVPAYVRPMRDDDALERAYRKFQRMFVGTTRSSA